MSAVYFFLTGWSSFAPARRSPPTELIAWSREHMAAYKVPHVVEFVDALPLSATGKVEWRRLQERENARVS